MLWRQRTTLDKKLVVIDVVVKDIVKPVREVCGIAQKVIYTYTKIPRECQHNVVARHAVASLILGNAWGRNIEDVG